jgi:D-alanyl-D-alanine carboxypeptidase
VNRRAATTGVRLGMAALLGLTIGAGVMLETQRVPIRPADTDRPTTSGLARAARAPSERVLLVWASHQLPAGLAARLRSVPGIGSVTTVEGDLVGLAKSTTAERHPVDSPGKGMVIPIDAIAFDPATYPAFLPVSSRAAFRHLGHGEALLGATSARLRRLGPGGRLLVGGSRWLTVGGVVDDSLVGGAELAVTSADGGGVGVHTDRYLLVGYRTERAKVETAVRERLPGRLAVRFRGPGETPFFRNGDAVLPQALVKERFGEFAYRPGPGRAFTEDPRWETANIVTAKLPILGRVRCHRALMRALGGALHELQQRNLSPLIDPAGFGGCWNPRVISVGSGVSRHAWGAAVDLNTRGNPTGLESAQDPRLVEVMRRWGFTWGGHWLIPDPSHFEFLQAPRG